MTFLQSKMRACLLGGAIGDALGYAVEFDRLRTIRQLFPPEGIRQYVLNAKTGKAIISDDTQMTLFTAYGLLRGQVTAWQVGSYPGNPANFIYKAYLDWLRTQQEPMDLSASNFLLREPALWARRAPGGTCLKALASGQMGTLRNPLNDSKGCGGVMRVAPIAMLYGDKGLSQVALEGANAAAITHSHPLGYIPAAYLCYLVAEGLFGTGKSLAQAAQDANGVMEQLFGKNTYTARHRQLMEQALALAENDEPDTDNIALLGEGWVGEETMAVSLYCAVRHFNDFSAAVVAAVNHDGDSDSTGAVTGNLLGAWRGMAAIEPRWVTDLEMAALITEMADDLYYANASVGFAEAPHEPWVARYL